ncbi:MAG: putative quinol monooxygenase [Phycisphaeraceae bacterium]|nr:putative quinol monooxygenase [Phycisphaeraceae bacterium]
MIEVVATLKIADGGMNEFLKKFNANCPAVRAEEGCIKYYPTVDAETDIDRQDRDPNVVVVLEKWKDADALKAHLQAPHMEAFRKEVGHLIESATLKILTRA